MKVNRTLSFRVKHFFKSILCQAGLLLAYLCIFCLPISTGIYLLKMGIMAAGASRIIHIVIGTLFLVYSAAPFFFKGKDWEKSQNLFAENDGGDGTDLCC